MPFSPTFCLCEVWYNGTNFLKKAKLCGPYAQNIGEICFYCIFTNRTEVMTNHKQCCVLVCVYVCMGVCVCRIMMMMKTDRSNFHVNISSIIQTYSDVISHIHLTKSCSNRGTCSARRYIPVSADVCLDECWFPHLDTGPWGCWRTAEPRAGTWPPVRRPTAESSGLTNPAGQSLWAHHLQESSSTSSSFHTQLLAKDIFHDPKLCPLPTPNH